MSTRTQNDSHRKIIACVGFVCLDIVNYVSKYPDEDSENHCEPIWTVGGNAANSCKVLSGLDQPFQLFGVLAKDHTLPFMRNQLQRFDVPPPAIVRQSDTMPTSTIIVNTTTGSRTSLFGGTLKEITFEEFKMLAEIKLQDYSWIHFEARNLDEIQKILQWLVEMKTNSNGRLTYRLSVELEQSWPEIDQLIMPGLDVIFLSRAYAESRGFNTMEDAVKKFGSRYSSLPADPLLATLTYVICAWGDKGASGVSCKDLDNVVSSAAFPPTDGAVDTLGAGDTFIAGALYKLNIGGTLQEGLDFGCRLAGYKCGFRGFDFIGKLQSEFSEYI